eukprot:6190415-Pleurochrysis_carterae.AAC.1
MPPFPPHWHYTELIATSCQASWLCAFLVSFKKATSNPALVQRVFAHVEAVRVAERVALHG